MYEGMNVLLRQSVKMSIWAGIVCAVMATAIVIIAPHAGAVEQKANATNTLRISPVRSDIQVKPGESKTVEVVIINLTDAPMTVRAITNDFIAGDERGTPALILDPDKYAPSHSLKRFMKPISDITIPAGEDKVVDVVINVPKNAQAGGYFGAVRFAPTDPDGGGQVNMSASVASLILLTVPGPMTEKLDLTTFNIEQGGKAGTFFQSANDLTTVVRFESKSNVQVAPFGKLSVKQGNKVVYEYDFNAQQPRDMILPDSARRWDVPLKNISSFGNYTVYATLTYGTTNQTIETSKSFWVVPWIVIAAAIGAVLLLIGLVLTIILMIRRRKRRVHLGSHGGGRGGGYRRY